ncbi:unnamed protein product, partial [Polarella glacialis]
MCLQAVEPQRALRALRDLERKVRLATAAGSALPDVWGELCSDVDALLDTSAPAPKSTPLDVAKALAELRVASGQQAADQSASYVSAAELRALGHLPCAEALRLLDSLYRHKAPPPRPESSQDGGLLACEAAFWAARLEGGTQPELGLRRAVKASLPVRPSLEQLKLLQGRVMRPRQGMVRRTGQISGG